MGKLIRVLLLLSLVWLAACNPVKKQTSTGTPGTPPSTPSAPADTGDTIKFGFNLEESGPHATFGQSSHKGAQMAIDEINAAGGVLGKQIEPVFDDNACEPSQAATVASKLVNQDKVQVLIGAVASSNSIAMAKIAEEAKIPMVSPASTNPSVTVNDDGTVREYIFRTCFTDDFQGEGMVDFSVNGPIKAKTAVIFYDSENDYSIGIWERIKQVAAEKGLTIVAEDSYLASSETDYRSKLSKFKGQQFDVLIVPGYYGQVSQIANQARELGITQPLVGGDGWDSADLWKGAGKNIEGSYFTNHYASDDQDPAVQDFITKYKGLNGGNVPDAMAILAYDTVKVVADAIERAGSTDGAAIASALASTKNFKGSAGTITINEKHNATKKLVVLEVLPGGSYKWVYSYDPNKPGGGETPAEGSADTEASTTPKTAHGMDGKAGEAGGE